MVSRADLTLRSLKTWLVKILNHVLTIFFWSNCIILLTRRHNIGKNLEGLGLRKNEKDGHPSNPKQFITAFFGKSEGGSWCGHDHPSLPHCGCCGCTMGPKKKKFQTLIFDCQKPIQLSKNLIKTKINTVFTWTGFLHMNLQEMPKMILNICRLSEHGEFLNFCNFNRSFSNLI